MDKAGIIAQADEKFNRGCGCRRRCSYQDNFPSWDCISVRLSWVSQLNISEFGFWMMNACPLQQGQDETKPGMEPSFAHGCQAWA